MPARAKTPPFPTFESGEDELRAFRKARKWIINAAEDRSETKAARHRTSPNEGWYGFLKRQSYDLIRHYIERGDVRTFERVVRSEGRQLSARVPIVENPFHYGLLALYPSGDDEMITRSDRSAFALQMIYAYQHRVPAELLVGFIYQSGSQAQIRDRYKSGKREEGFDETYNADIWADALNIPEIIDPDDAELDEPTADDEIDLGGDDDLGIDTGEDEEPY